MGILCKNKKVISWFLIATMLITLLPSNMVTKAEDAGGTVSRKVSDLVEASNGEEKVQLDLYSNGIYETKLNIVSGAAISLSKNLNSGLGNVLIANSVTGSAITLSVNGVSKGTTSWTPGGESSVYIRYNSVTEELTNSISNPSIYKQSATWVGNFTGIDAGINNWSPEDVNGDLNYIGGGIYAKTFQFTTTTSEITLADGGYKVAYNHGWNNGEVANNIPLTIPVGVNSITIYADTNTGFITDSITTPGIGKIVSLIGTVRESGNDDWNSSLYGWEMKQISREYYTFSKVFAIPGTYEYKCTYNHANEWPSWDNKEIKITEPNTNVVFLYHVAEDNMYDSINNYNTVSAALGFNLNGEPELPLDSFISQPGGNSVWRVTGSLGNYDNWNINNLNTILSHLVGEYYATSMVLDAGNYEFKFTKNGSWDNAIGSDGISNNSANIKMNLTEKTKVDFYLNDDLEGQDKVRVNISGLESQGIKQYIPALPDGNWPRLVGNLQTALGETADWSPSTSKQMFIDYYFNNTVYKLQRTLPYGNFECKSVFGDSWNGTEVGDPAGPGGNLGLKLMDATTDVTFSLDNSGVNKVFTYNYKSVDSNYDGIIDKASLYFDSRSLTYKKPFGAIKQGEEDVTFRFAAKNQDVQLVKLELIDNNGISLSYNMAVSTVIQGLDYWEVTVPGKVFKEIGIWGYKFLIIDGTTKVEYGDDGLSGGVGAVSDDGQTPYNLTVYANDYATPDWMKKAVVYQIFPDRFFDGDSTNNHAKDADGIRGDDIQLFDGSKWSTIPENPRQSEEANKPYYPDATTDGVWSNEFYGGDIAGIEQKFSYLKTLGVTAIYLNPVSWAASNHKYDATDYKHLDPMFGKPVYNTPGDPASGLNYEATKAASDKVYSEFTKACDSLGIHLISDGVFNHVGDDSIYFDRYEKYPEIGAYEYWSKVWKEVENNKVSQAKAEATVKNYFKSQINPTTGKNYTDGDFNYIHWFKVGPNKIYDETIEAFRYEYEGWWGYDSLPAVAATAANDTNLSNDSSASIAGVHEYNTVDYRENVIGYDLNQSNITNVNTAMQEANSQRWLWMGANGWRLDVAPDVSDETWKQFRIAVKSAKGKTDVNGNSIDDPVILGEEWNVATHYLLGDMFDSVMNYQFRSALQNFIVNNGDASELNNSLEIIRENYPKEAWQTMLNLVDSHDTTRNITKIDNPTWEEENIKVAPEASERAIKLQALTAIFQMSYPGAPTIYYGDEVGVTGTKDPDSRRTFPWERVVKTSDDSYKISSSFMGTYGELFDTYVTASNVRNKYIDLFATGDIKTAYAQGDVIAFARKSGKEGGLSVINKSDQDVDITANVKDFLPDGLILEDTLGSGIQATVVDGTLSFKIPGYSGLMMVSTTELTALPASPTNLTATATEGETGKVTLTWNEVQGASGYYVYRTLLEGMETTQLNATAITDTSYTDNDVINGTRYYYYVKSVVEDSTSIYSNVATALPSYKITEIGIPTPVTIDTIGVGKKTGFTDVAIIIPGLTNNSEYVGKEVPRLLFDLAFYKDGTSADTAILTKLRYKADRGDSKVYTAAFEPTEEGIYKYYAMASVNNGASYTVSAEANMNAPAAFTAPAPEAPILMQPVQESSRVTLNWSVPPVNTIAGFDIYRTSGVSENTVNPEYKIATVAKNTTTFTDFMVSNDTAYTYRIVAFNQEYNRTSSQTVMIVPKLTMIDVTIRLTIPDKVYTSATDNIYIAGDVNGWNASGWLMKKPSGATDSNVVEYSFKMMAGKKIQYKYTRGTWSTEALTSNIAGDTTSPGNYAYSSIDTNINLTISNQGNNKMLVNDNVLRWVDMPIMITVPRISYKGETIEYTTVENSFNLQASVPYGGIFTINGKDINSINKGALDQYGNVRLDNIPLEKGVNEFVLHIEPTEETKAKPWLTDIGRITSQMSATTTLRITKTTETKPPIPTEPPKPTDPPTPTQPPTDPTTPSTDGSTTTIPGTKEPNIAGKDGSTGWKTIEKELSQIIANLGEEKDGSNDSAKEPEVIKINMNSTTVLPKEIIEIIKGKNVQLTLNYGDYSWTILGKSIGNDAVIAKDFDLKISETKDSKLISAITKATNAAIKKSKINWEVTLIQQFEIAYNGEFPFAADLTIYVGSKYSNQFVYLNYYNEKTKKIELYDYAKVNKDGYVTLSFDHASSYVLTSENPILPTVINAKTIHVGTSYQLKISNTLELAKITYSSSKKSIATISKTGSIKAKKEGSAIITIKVVQAGKTYIYKTKVTVKK